MNTEQASKGSMWMPTRQNNGEGRCERVKSERPLEARNRQPDRSTGVMVPACAEGLVLNVRDPRRREVANHDFEQSKGVVGVGEVRSTDECG